MLASEKTMDMFMRVLKYTAVFPTHGITVPWALSSKTT